MKPVVIKWGGSGFAEVTSFGGGVFRARIGHGRKTGEYPSYAIVNRPQPTGEVASPRGGAKVLASSDGWLLEVRANPKGGTLGLRLVDPDGVTVFSTAVPSGGVSHSRRDGLSLRFELPSGVQYYGLGEFGERVGRVPGRYRCWNTDDPNHQALKQPYCCIPFLASPGASGNHAHALFVDNPGNVTFDLGVAEQGLGVVSAPTGQLDLWLIGAASPAALLGRWTDLTGRMPRPPLWSLGFHQSRYSYMSADEVREICGELRRRDIPASAVHLDIDYMDEYKVFTWHRKAFSRPEKLNADLRAKRIRTVAIVDPGVMVSPGYGPYDEGMAKGYFITGEDGKPVTGQTWPGLSHHPDFTMPAVREWWGRLVGEALLGRGVSGIWCDMNEPGVWDDIGFGIKILRDIQGEGRHHDEGAGRTNREVHNVYGLCMAQAVHEGMVRARPDERPFVLTRSGYAGIQRHAAIWTGDDRSTHWAMPLDLTGILSLSACGVPFSGCDIGGFLSDSNAPLFARWMDWGALLPFCRAHTAKGTVRQEPWSFGREVEAAARRMLKLRMELMPYLYSAFVESSETGLPVARPLWMGWPRDPQCREIGDQFLLGADILVAPVLQPGIEHRAVYLPEGEWYPLEGGEPMKGGRWIAAHLPPGFPPAFVRAGAVIPRAEGWDGTQSDLPGRIVLDVYPARGRLAGRLVEDDGITMDYARGAELRRVFAGSVDARGIRLAAKTAPGKPPICGAPITRLYWKATDTAARAVRVNDKAVAARWDATHPLELAPDTPTFDLRAQYGAAGKARRSSGK